MIKQILESVRLHFESEKSKAKTNIAIYLSNPSGIGEHSKVVEEIISLMEEYDKNKSILDTMDSDFTTEPEYLSRGEKEK